MKKLCLHLSRVPLKQKLQNKPDKCVDKSASMLTQQLIIQDRIERNLADSAFSKKERPLICYAGTVGRDLYRFSQYPRFMPSWNSAFPGVRELKAG